MQKQSENCKEYSACYGDFFRRQWSEIHGGGIRVLRYKLVLLVKRVKSSLLLILFLPMYGILLALVRLIRPWLLIRIGELESSGIGHFSLPVEIFLCETARGLHKPRQRHVDIWFLQRIVCNRELLNIWESFFTIWPRWIIQPISLLNKVIPGGQPHRIPYRYVDDALTPWQYCDIHHVLQTTQRQLTFSSNDEYRGLSELSTIGIERNDSFVCIMARDKAFYSEDHMKWDHRNSSILTIVRAVDVLIRRDIKVVRMGAKVSEIVDTARNKMIIDYANSGKRTEFLDLYLISRCRFMVSTGVGIDAVAPTFRKKRVFVNFAEFGNADLASDNLIFIPKKFWSITDKRFLTFKEIFALGAHLFSLARQYYEAGIEWIDNDVDEIRSVILEMEQRLSGHWVEYPEDESLQNRFRELWPTRANGLSALESRIGAEYLRNNKFLLE